MFKNLTKYYLSLLLVFVFSYGFSQSKVTISGIVKDKENGEVIIGARIFSKTFTKQTSTNAYGRFSLLTEPGEQEINITYLGYKMFAVKLKADKDITLNVELEPEGREVETTVIRADGLEQNLNNAQMSKVELSINQIKQLPAIFGEVDLLKTIQLLPGIQSGGEGQAGFFVRGGGADQNLIVLDEAVVYNVSHLFGFFSVFNSDAIKNVELYKGGFPAQYGGRLSSVIDINMKDGNNKEFHSEGGIGLIASRATIEGPIVKDKSSFLVSGRRTYVDVFTRALNGANSNNENWIDIPSYYFYDLNTKLNYELSDKDRLYLSGYFGRDDFSFDDPSFDFGFNWGNATGTARWNHVFSPRLFSNFTGTFTDYRYTIKTKIDDFELNVGSRIQDWTLKSDFFYTASEKHKVKFGALYTYHKFGLGRIQLQSNDPENQFNFENDNELFGTELGLYVSDDWDVSEEIKLDYGVRFSGFLPKNKIYTGIEPRLAVRYRLSPNTSLKASYNLMNQYMQLISNSGASLPLDIWFPSTENVKPQRASQYAAGFTTLVKDRILLTVEGFYKDLSNQVDYKDNAQLFFNDNLETEFVFGRGYAYGGEFLAEKKSGKTTGWVAYTLSWSWREFNDINNGERFHPRSDSRHNLNIVVSHELNKKFTLSATFVYNSGNVISLPTGWTFVNDVIDNAPQFVPIYEKRNNYRAPAYHRADVSFIWKFFPKWGESNLAFSIYNVYNRLNPYFITIEQQTGVNNPLGGILPIPVGATAEQVSLFPILPAVTWNYKF
jgi:outer membrane cobalamin receptor